MASTSEIEKLERRYAENPDGRFFAPLADAYRKSGQVDRALELVRAGLAKHPDYLSAHIVLGRCLLDKGSDADAAATFQAVLALDGENIIALKSLAEIAERGGRVDEARDWLQKLLVVDSMNTEAEADLTRLGGAVPAAAKAVEEAPAEATPETSFADVAREMEAPAPADQAAPEPVAAAPEPVAAAPEPALAPAPPIFEIEPPAPVPAVLEFKPRAPEPAPAVRDLEPAAPLAGDMPTQPMEALVLDLPVEVPAPPAPEPVAAKPDIHPLPSEARVSTESLEVLPFDDSLAWGIGERSSRAIRAEDVSAVMHNEEIQTPAVEFMAELGVPTPEEAPPPAAAAAAPVMDFTLEEPPDQSLGGMAESAPTPNVELPANLSGAYSLVDEVPSPETIVAAAAAPHAAADLPLIMPEDVTPPEEMKRPSAKMVQTVSPPPREEPAAQPALITETMGDLYLKQGFRTEAADVYRQLLSQRPGDAGLAAKLRAVEGPPPDMSARKLGAESVGSWLKRVAVARLSAAAIEPPAAPARGSADVANGPSPLETAFAAPEPDAQGEPTHPAPDAFSLDQIFGPVSETRAPAAPRASATPPVGASFDEFFGPPPTPPAAPQGAPHPAGKSPDRPSKLGDEDLTAFSAWLQGLKK